MREELHERLEMMVDDVQALIAEKENPESIPANMESDELWDGYDAPPLFFTNAAKGFDTSSSHLLINTNCANYNFTPCWRRKSWKYSIKWRDMSNKEKLKRWKHQNPGNLRVKSRHFPKLRLNYGVSWIFMWKSSNRYVIASAYDYSHWLNEGRGYT